MKPSYIFPIYEERPWYQAKNLDADVVYEQRTDVPLIYKVILDYLEASIKDYRKARKEIQTTLEKCA